MMSSLKGHPKSWMAKSDKRRLREVRYTDKRRLRGGVFLSEPQQYMWYAEVLIKSSNEAGKRACETPDRTFYDAIFFLQCRGQLFHGEFFSRSVS